MRESLLPYLIAPDCGGPLTLTKARSENGEIIEGCLCDQAGRAYPIQDGIPCLLPSALQDSQRSEIAARDSQAAAYDRMAFLRFFGKIEIPMTIRALQAQRSDLLLEGGCGTGRMTAILADSVSELIAIDFSLESLRANRRKLQAARITNVHLIQADLCHLPLADCLFDRLVSCQVLEHVPDATARQAAVSELARVGKPRAPLVLSAYQHSRLTRLFGEKEGMHEGGIPFFRFAREELRELLLTRFAVEDITGQLVYLYLARCTKL